MAVLGSDVGLWVTGSGKLHAVGQAKSDWTRLTGSEGTAGNMITVENASGWRVGDQLVVAPSKAPTAADAHTAYSFHTIASVNTSTGVVQLNANLQNPHPEVAGKWTAEVMNLTRNVKIRGTDAGKAHVMFMSNVNQTIKNVELTDLGPRQYDPGHLGGEVQGVTGRYALHFHMMGDAARGSRVEGVAAHDIGNHTFVAHKSHGITFVDTIAHDTVHAAYWWDLGLDNRQPRRDLRHRPSRRCRSTPSPARRRSAWARSTWARARATP